MKYNEFINWSWSNSKAYILGLLFTRIDIGIKTDSNKNYLIGQIAHNPNMVTNNDIMGHLMNLSELLLKDNIDINNLTIFNDNIKIVSDDINKGRRSGKKGFVVGFEIDIDNENLERIKNKINTDLMELVKEIPDEHINYLLAGTIDGRSSYDTTLGFISIDINRDYAKQELIRKTISKKNIGIQINARDKNHKKADQLRYSPDYIQNILDTIPLLSNARIKKIRSALWN